MSQITCRALILQNINYIDTEIRMAESAVKQHIDALVDVSKRIATDFEMGRCTDSRGAASKCGDIDVATERLRQLHEKRRTLVYLEEHAEN